MALADAAIEELGAASVVVITIDHGLQPDGHDGSELVLGWARERGVAAVKRAVTVEPRASLEAADRKSTRLNSSHLH